MATPSPTSASNLKKRSKDDGDRDNEPPPKKVGAWSADEHARFLTGMRMFGRKKWTRVRTVVGTRTLQQVRSHAQKFFAKERRAQQRLQMAFEARCKSKDSTAQAVKDEDELSEND